MGQPTVGKLSEEEIAHAGKCAGRREPAEWRPSECPPSECTPWIRVHAVDQSAHSGSEVAMVPNPVPGGEEPTSTLPLGTPQTTHLADADAARELEGSLKKPPSIARDEELAEVEPPQSATGHSAIGVGATDQGVALEPMVRRIEARGAG